MAKISGSDIRPGMAIQVQLHQARPIGIKLPETVVLQMTEADAVIIKGQTAASSYKSATLENGLRLLERFPFLWNRKRALDSCISRIFYGEPLHTSPENALVPPFISAGEKVVVSTDEVSYVRRAG